MQNLYKYKYLKYKSKYLTAQYGGVLDNFIILTKMSELYPKFIHSDNLEFSADCTDVEKNLFGKAHVFKKKYGGFELMTQTNPICGKTISMLDVKKKLSEVNKEIGHEIKKDVLPVFTQLKKSTKDEIGKTIPILSEKIKGLGTSTIETVGEFARKKGIQKMDNFGKKMETLQRHSKTGGGGIGLKIISILSSIGCDYSDANAIEKIVNEYNYDVAIKFIPKLIGKSNFSITKLL